VGYTLNQFIRFTLFFTLLFSIFGTATPTAAKPAMEVVGMDIQLSELNSGEAISLAGLYSSSSLEIPIPDTYMVSGENWVLFNFLPSQQLDLERSSLTISLNDTQVASFRLNEQAGREKRVVLPAEKFQRGNNTLTFTAMLHLPDDNETVCSNWDDPSRWLNLSMESSLHLAVSPNNQVLDLATFPQSFIAPLDRFGTGSMANKTTFVLPNEPSSDDLTSIVTLAYLFGKQAGQDFPWQPVVRDEETFDAAEPDQGGVVLLNSLPTRVGAPATPERDLLMLSNTPWNVTHPSLFVGDIDGEDGFTPVTLLADPLRRVLMQGKMVYVDQEANQQPEAFKNLYTFEELGYLDRTVRGIGEGNLIYRVFIPYQMNIDGALLRLVISHSPDLDTANSSIMVNLNGFTVASIASTQTSAEFTPIEVHLPANRLRPGVNFVRLTFDMHTPYSSCERAPESVWATVGTNSELQLSYRQANRSPDLIDFPMPFSDYPSFAFLVPDAPNAQTMERIASLAFRLGQDAQFTNQPPVVIQASKFKPEATLFRNFIVVGLPTDNSVLKDINRNLPQPFTEDGLGLAPGFGVFLPNNTTEAPIGLVQILNSPWSLDGVLLVITGTNAQGLDWTWETLLDQAKESELSGNLMVVGSDERLADGTANAPITTFEDTPDVTNLPVFGAMLQKLQPGDVFPVLSVLEAAVIILLVVLFFIRRRREGEQ
jgi:hypothetical protein